MLLHLLRLRGVNPYEITKTQIVKDPYKIRNASSSGSNKNDISKHDEILLFSLFKSIEYHYYGSQAVLL